jgi:hypothetical protein
VPRTAGSPPQVSRDELAATAYPSLRQAAELIGVNASTLSRRKDVARVRAGQEVRMPAREVIRLAAVYRRRPLSEVAAALVARAQRFPGSAREAVTTEVDQALELHQAPPTEPTIDMKAFLSAADSLLPAHLAFEVRTALAGRATNAEATGGVVGWSPNDD